MDRTGSCIRIDLIDDDGDTDLAGSDHLDIDISIEQCFKHFCCNTWICHHAGTNYRYLGNVFFMLDPLCGQLGQICFQYF